MAKLTEIRVCPVCKRDGESAVAEGRNPFEPDLQVLRLFSERGLPHPAVPLGDTSVCQRQSRPDTKGEEE